MALSIYAAVAGTTGMVLNLWLSWREHCRYRAQQARRDQRRGESVPTEYPDAG